MIRDTERGKNLKTIQGIYGSATIFTTDNPETAIDSYAISQLQLLCDNEASKNSKIRVMPDVHPGKVGTIGLTMTIQERLLPNLVGIDIGCGITLAKIKAKTLEFQKLDTCIRENIPSGFSIRSKSHPLADSIDLSSLSCCKHIQADKAYKSLGTLGGGNHFIEIDKTEEGELYVIIHSGSRHLGKEVTEYYLNEGQKKLKAAGLEVPYELTYLEELLLADYLHDLDITQQFAALNREIILYELCKKMKWKVEDTYSVVHNYIDFDVDPPILRKGAISAKAGEPVIIPINMRDGVLLGTGRGNEEWNQSAPHGSGRRYRRDMISSLFTVSAFKSEMKGIYTSCISKDTLDEAPFAYRPANEIIEAIKDTVEITKQIKPIYNFKAGQNG